MRRFVNIENEEGQRVLCVAADGQNEYRTEDLAFLCDAHNELPGVLAELTEQTARAASAFRALRTLALAVARDPLPVSDAVADELSKALDLVDIEVVDERGTNYPEPMTPEKPLRRRAIQM